MQLDIYRSDLPVLLLYNIDPSWSGEDIQACIETTRILSNALQEIGHPIIEVRDRQRGRVVALAVACRGRPHP